MVLALVHQAVLWVAVLAVLLTGLEGAQVSLDLFDFVDVGV